MTKETTPQLVSVDSGSSLEPDLGLDANAQTEFKQFTEQELKEINGVLRGIKPSELKLRDQLPTGPAGDIRTQDLAKLSGIKEIRPNAINGNKNALTQVKRWLSQIGKGEFDINDLPESVILQRDWSDNLREHQTKQVQLLERFGDILDARLIARGYEEEREDRKTRVAAHNDEIAFRQAVIQERNTYAQEVRNNLVLKYGKRMAELFADEIEQEVGKALESKFGEAPKDPNAYYADSEDNLVQKKERRLRTAESQAAHHESVKNFNKGISPNEANKYGYIASEDGGKNLPALLVEEVSSRYRIDKKQAEDRLNYFKSKGMPDKLLQQIQGSVFYADDDPGKTDYFAGAVGDWMEENKARFATKIEITKAIPDTKEGLSKRLRSKIKEAWNATPAVRFDGKDYNGNKVPGKKVGDAIIDTSNREYKGKHVLAIAGLGVLAAGAAYLTTRGINMPLSLKGSPAEIPGLGLSDTANLQLDTIHTETPAGFINGALDSLKKQGFEIDGVTDEKVKAIREIMETMHMQTRVGMKEGVNGLTPNLVDVAKDWKDGVTGNAYASKANGFKDINQLQQFIEICKSEGINIRRVS